MHKQNIVKDLLDTAMICCEYTQSNTSGCIITTTVPGIHACAKETTAKPKVRIVNNSPDLEAHTWIARH